jgi:hypothetical protein
MIYERPLPAQTPSRPLPMLRREELETPLYEQEPST